MPFCSTQGIINQNPKESRSEFAVGSSNTFGGGDLKAGVFMAVGDFGDGRSTTIKLLLRRSILRGSDSGFGVFCVVVGSLRKSQFRTSMR